jgi:hypothetical protein
MIYIHLENNRVWSPNIADNCLASPTVLVSPACLTIAFRSNLLPPCWFPLMLTRDRLLTPSVATAAKVHCGIRHKFFVISYK